MRGGSTRILSPEPHKPETFQAVRALVVRHGWNSTAYQILNPGIEHWLNDDGSAAVGFVERYGFLLVAGAPVCELALVGIVASQFEAFARGKNCRVCYVCAADRLRDILSGTGEHAVVTMGAQPVWDPRRWDGILQTRASLREQIQRARNKGVEVTEIPAEAGCVNSELRNTLAEWLKTRALPPMRFLVEPNALELCAPDRVLLAARLRGSIVAYLLASPVPARNGFLIEQVVRGAGAPNGASELLIHEAMRRFALEGRTYCTLGLVALADQARGGIDKNPGWLRLMMLLARRYANRFYNFDGLERFRMKMNPHHWEPIYAISNEREFSPHALYAMGAAFSGISPWRAIAIALGRAVLSGSVANKES